MPIAKLHDVRRALVLPVFCRRLPRDAVILLWEYVEGPARFFYNVWPGEETFREWELCMELISDFLGEEGWQSLAPTNRSVWILWNLANLIPRPSTGDSHAVEES